MTDVWHFIIGYMLGQGVTAATVYFGFRLAQYREVLELQTYTGAK